MLYGVKYFLKRPFIVEGEEYGQCSDILFDDAEWRLRYFVIKEGRFLASHESLIGPSMISRGEIGARSDGIPILESKDKVDTAPRLESHLPVSRRKEVEFALHYNWTPYYLPSAQGIGVGLGDMALDEAFDREASGDPHLRSLKEIVGYDLRNGDEFLGEVVNLVLDFSDFSIPYLAVDVKPNERGGVRLISTRDEENRLRFDFPTQSVLTDCSAYHLMEGPSADLSDGRLSLGDQQKVTLSLLSELG